MDNSSNEDIISELKQWMDYEGFPTEMKVAQVFRENDFDVSQGWSFQDEVTMKPREVDLIVYGDFFGEYAYRICPVIECKKSERVFLALSYGYDYGAAFFGLGTRLGNSLGQMMLNELKENGVMDALPINEPIFPLSYNLIQSLVSVKNGKVWTKKQGQDRAFDALIKTTKATTTLNLLSEGKQYIAPDGLPKLVAFTQGNRVFIN